MDRLFVTLGALSGAFGIAAGAFATHALRSKLSPDSFGLFEDGARYQVYHALSLCVVGLVAGRWPGSLVRASGWLFVAGTVLFCGSLYALALTDERWIGAVAPVGGASMIAGWICLAMAAARGRPAT